MLAAVAEIVFQVIAFGFEYVIVFVFHFPTGPAIPDHSRDGGFRKRAIGDKRVVIDLFSRSLLVTKISHQLTVMASSPLRKGT